MEKNNGIIFFIVFVLIIILISSLRPKSEDEIILERLYQGKDNIPRTSDGAIDCSGEFQNSYECQLLFKGR